MIKLALFGAGGRMGKAILAQTMTRKDITVTGLLESEGSPLLGQPINGAVVTSRVEEAVKDCDVVIDFTFAHATVENARVVAKAGRALVVGTTGITGSLKDQLLAAVRTIPVVWSPNMSLSANILFDVTEKMAKLLPEYNAEITETHHNLKKDAPSGTAQGLAEAVAKGRSQSNGFVYGRHGLVGERKAAEIGVHSLRGGDVVGDHTVYFFGQGERIELVHRVTSRDAFAAGAVAAALWVAGKDPGLYDMRDVLGLKQ